MLTQQPWVERCVAASNGEDAIELARRYRPHVAVVDLFIGEESGAQVCERLREAEPTTRVLLFSGAGEISASALAPRVPPASPTRTGQRPSWPPRCGGSGSAAACSSATTALA